jgi:hypothetical protein
MKKNKSVNENQEIAFVVYVNREALKNLLIRLYKEYLPGDDVSFSGLLGKLMIIILECDHTCVMDDALMKTLKGFEEIYKSMMDENNHLNN